MISTIRVADCLTEQLSDCASLQLLAYWMDVSCTTGTTGMGLALVGGIGHLYRPYDLTTDALINATIVLINGSILRPKLAIGMLCVILQDNCG